MRELRCKGLMLRNRLQLLEERCDVEGALFPLLGAELRDGLAYGRIVPGGWYPIAWLRELHAAAEEVTGRGDELAWELGAEGAKRNFKTVHRAFLTVLSPSGLLKRAPRVFGAYFDGGRYEVTRSEKGMATLRIAECHGFDRPIWQAIAGTADEVLRMCRAEDVKARFVPGATLSEGELHATWR